MSASAKRKRHLRNHVLTGRAVMAGLWADALLVMASSAYNGGEAFVALHQPQGQGVALGVAVDVALAVALIGDRALHLEDRSSNWGRAIRVITAGMSLALNCAVPIWQGHPGVAAFHAFLPVLLVLLAEYAQDVTLQFGEIAEEYEAEAKGQVGSSAVQHRAVPAPQPVFRPGGFQPPSGPGPSRPPFSAVPNLTTARPETSERNVPAPVPETPRAVVPSRPAERPVDRPVERPAARPARRPRPAVKKPTDEQLIRTVREMAAENGQPPSPYQVKNALGVGHARAARLVAELETTPAGPPSGNGAATRKEGTQ